MRITIWLFIKAVRNALVIWLCSIHEKLDRSMLEPELPSIERDANSGMVKARL